MILWQYFLSTEIDTFTHNYEMITMQRLTHK